MQIKNSFFCNEIDLNRIYRRKEEKAWENLMKYIAIMLKKYSNI
jgi:hypothetical protein